MKNKSEDTPPSSLNGDEISGMDDDELYMFEEVEEISLNDDEEFMETEDGEMEFEEREPVEDHATLVFDKHKGSVFCCDLHPDGKLAATGGEDDKAYVWSIETGQVVMECTGHKDSIVFIGFCFDGAYLATADMGGLIKVWKVNTEESQQQPWPVAFEYEADDISWGQWHFGARVLMIGADTGDIYVFKIPSGDVKILKGHNVKVECGKVSIECMYTYL